MNTSGIYYQLTQAILKNQLTLPSLPDIALKIRTAVTNPEIEINDICELLSYDISLTHHLINVANSPIYRGVTEIKTLPNAISRFGFSATQNLVLNFVLKSLFRSKHSNTREQLSWIWEHSKKISAMSATLAKHCKHLTSEKAIIAGLFVNIGTLAIIPFLEKRKQLPNTQQQLWKMVNPIADKIGTQILQHWNFEEDLCNVTRLRQHWDEQNNEKVNYSDIVLVAEALIQIPEHIQNPQQWFEQLPSRKKLFKAGIPITDLELSDELKQQYEENLKLLSF